MSELQLNREHQSMRMMYGTYADILAATRSALYSLLL